jgi:hypothetical protein
MAGGEGTIPPRSCLGTYLAVAGAVFRRAKKSPAFSSPTAARLYTNFLVSNQSVLYVTTADLEQVLNVNLFPLSAPS